MKLSEAQHKIAEIYGHKDRDRGIPGTFMYFSEEVGELATSLREGSKSEQASEYADVLAWLMSLASLSKIDLEKAFIEKYSTCRGCQKALCECETKA